MEVPIITKKQLKSTLSVKKTKTKEVIKNVLALPYKNSFWPELPPGSRNQIQKVLEQNLPRVKAEKINIPWEKIKTVPKVDRRKFRYEYLEKMNIQWPNTSESEGLILGINDVTKHLENNSISCVVISSDVQPKLMVQHIIDQTVMKKIPILIVSNLRKLTKIYCGISSVALGITEKCTGSLVLIKSCVEQLFKKISPPEDHVNFDRLQLINNFNQRIEETKNDMKETDCDKSVKNEEQIMSSIYLKIDGHSGRVFIPEAKKEIVQHNSFANKSYIKAHGKIDKKSGVKYKSLKVKRFKGDISRAKKKIKSLKKM